jgi:hypothetical protein
MYNLLVRGSDRDGATDGLSSECDCRIKILDVNDNFPILEKTSVSHYSNYLSPLLMISLSLCLFRSLAVIAWKNSALLYKL